LANLSFAPLELVPTRWLEPNVAAGLPSTVYAPRRTGFSRCAPRTAISCPRWVWTRSFWSTAAPTSFCAPRASRASIRLFGGTRGRAGVATCRDPVSARASWTRYTSSTKLRRVMAPHTETGPTGGIPPTMLRLQWRFGVRLDSSYVMKNQSNVDPRFDDAGEARGTMEAYRPSHVPSGHRRRVYAVAPKRPRNRQVCIHPRRRRGRWQQSPTRPGRSDPDRRPIGIPMPVRVLATRIWREASRMRVWSTLKS